MNNNELNTQEKLEYLNEQETDSEPPVSNRQRLSSRSNRTSKMYRNKLTFLPFAIMISLGLGILIGWLICEIDINNVTVDKKLYQGVIYAAADDHKSASIHLKQLTDKQKLKLSAEERRAVFTSHLHNDRFEWALAVHPQGAEQLTAYLLKKNNMHMVNNINSTLPPVAFEKAILQKHYKRILKLEKDIVITERRQRYIVEALIMTGKLNQAIKYVKDHNLTDITLDMEYAYYKYAKEAEVTVDKQGQDILKISKLSD